MEVAAEFKSLDHSLAVCHVGQNSELKLSVVSNNQSFARLSDKSFPNLVDVFLSRRLVL